MTQKEMSNTSKQSDFSLFWSFGHSDLFRISIFEFRISMRRYTYALFLSVGVDNIIHHHPRHIQSRRRFQPLEAGGVIHLEHP